MTSSQVWVNDPPSSILNLLVSDVITFVNQYSLPEVSKNNIHDEINTLQEYYMHNNQINDYVTIQKKKEQN
jgi:hypothetical protein